MCSKHLAAFMQGKFCIHFCINTACFQLHKLLYMLVPQHLQKNLMKDQFLLQKCILYFKSKFYYTFIHMILLNLF